MKSRHQLQSDMFSMLLLHTQSAFRSLVEPPAGILYNGALFYRFRA